MAKTSIVVNLHMTVDTVPQLFAALKALEDRELLVGVPEDKDARDEGGINNATLALIQNEGSPAQGIPAREFMESGVESVQDKITPALKKAGGAALDGDIGAIDKGFNAAGLVAVSGIRKKIVDGPFEPLKPATLKARQRQGFKGTKPLNVTGQLRNAMSYVVRKKRR